MTRRRHYRPDQAAVAVHSARIGYEAALPSRYRAPTPHISSTGESGDYYLGSDYDRIRLTEQARDVARNDPIVRSAITRLRSQVIGDGFTLDPGTGSEALDQVIVQKWHEYSDDPARIDASERHNLTSIAGMCLRAMFVDGDIFAHPVRSGAIQLIEAHRVRKPASSRRKGMIHGILVNRYRAPRELWVTQESDTAKGSELRVRDMTKIPWQRNGVLNVMHIVDPDRVSQTRGVSPIAAVMNDVNYRKDIDFAQLLQQFMQSCAVLIRQQPDRMGDPNDTSTAPATGETETVSRRDGGQDTYMEMAPGLEIMGMPGEQITLATPNIPSTNAMQQLENTTQRIGLMFSMPLILLMMDASETNFSGWRGAVDVARREFRTLQGILRDRLYRPTYHHFLRMLAANDEDYQEALSNAARELDGNVLLNREKWGRPRWPYVEPLKDTQARIAQAVGNITSMRRLLWEDGAEWNVVANEIVDDRALLIEAAIARANEINQRHPEARLRWEVLAGLEGSPAIVEAMKLGQGQPTTEGQQQ